MHRDLVERAMAGDHDAFSELTRGSVAKLYAIARLIVRDIDQAEDATQEALVAAWRQLRSLRDPDRFDAWLRRLLVRACYREANKRQHWRHLEAQVQPFLADVPDPARFDACKDGIGSFHRHDGKPACGITHELTGSFVRFTFGGTAARQGCRTRPRRLRSGQICPSWMLGDGQVPRSDSYVPADCVAEITTGIDPSNRLHGRAACRTSPGGIRDKIRLPIASAHRGRPAPLISEPVALDRSHRL